MAYFWIIGMARGDVTQYKGQTSAARQGKETWQTTYTKMTCPMGWTSDLSWQSIAKPWALTRIVIGSA